MKLTITATGRGKPDKLFDLITRAIDDVYDGFKTLEHGKTLEIDMAGATKTPRA